jgi:TetR/AcrR family transcriptional repressor of mexJK operon
MQNLTSRTSRNRARILAAAETTFLKKGFLGSNMDEIAAAAGVSKQTVYSHFKAKEALFVEVVETMTGGGAAAHQERVSRPSPERSAEEYFFEFATQLLDIVLTPRLMRLRRLVIGEVERFPELGKSLYRRGPESSIQRLSEAIEFFIARGELVSTDARAAARFFNWFVMGGPTSDVMLLGDAAVPKQKEKHYHAAECVRIFLAAYGPRT